jgi:glucose 1-dehydrogenase
MNPDQTLAGQRALVTGASTGIGAAIAQAFAGAGARVVVNYVNGPDKADAVVAAIARNGGEAVALRADVTDERAVQAMFGAACERYGSIDILVNNAGVQQDAPLLDMSLADWQKVISVNLTGAFLCAREAAREFVRRGVVPELSCAAGKIVFISSVHDAIPWAGHANYAASKGGLTLLMKTIAQELAPHRIRVNGISPGAIRTDINRDAWQTQQARAALTELIPYGRIGEPADVARAAAWLASDAADYVHGATLYVDGGMMLYPAFRKGG